MLEFKNSKIHKSIIVTELVKVTKLEQMNSYHWLNCQDCKILREILQSLHACSCCTELDSHFYYFSEQFADLNWILAVYRNRPTTECYRQGQSRTLNLTKLSSRQVKPSLSLCTILTTDIHSVHSSYVTLSAVCPVRSGSFSLTTSFLYFVVVRRQGGVDTKHFSKFQIVQMSWANPWN